MAIMTSAILGTLVGGLTSAIPAILRFFERREELKFEREMRRLKMEQARYEAEQEIRVINTEADAFEGESLRRHDSSLDDSGFFGKLRVSVRPVITYCFFFTFLAVKAIAIYTFMQSGASGDWLGNTMALTDLYPIIWDENTQAIFGAIMGFWFGSRTIERLRGR